MKSVLNDAINFSTKLSARRISNAWLNYRSFHKSLKTKSTIHPGLPVSISLEPTTSCNLRCPECPSGLRSFTRPTGMMTKETYELIIDELQHHISYMILYFQGEPYLNPNFLETVKYANDRKIYTATSTNAHFLNPENSIKTIASGLDRIIISMDGTDQETYEKYRIGGQVEKVFAGIEKLVNTRKRLKSRKPYIILQFLLFEHNISQLPHIKKLAKTLEIDKLELKTAQVYNYENGSDLIPKNDRYSRYNQNDNNKYQIKSDHLNKCWKMWHSCVMTWDGDIVPCCFDKDAKYVMGNIHDQSFREIWNGERYRHFRSRLFDDRKGIDICKNCTEGLKN
jgi:radical SAM protein with 4Fe4S-binding SPASM domain